MSLNGYNYTKYFVPKAWYLYAIEQNCTRNVYSPTDRSRPTFVSRIVSAAFWEVNHCKGSAGLQWHKPQSTASRWRSILYRTTRTLNLARLPSRYNRLEILARIGRRDLGAVHPVRITRAIRRTERCRGDETAGLDNIWTELQSYKVSAAHALILFCRLVATLRLRTVGTHRLPVDQHLYDCVLCPSCPTLFILWTWGVTLCVLIQRNACVIDTCK